MGGCQTDNERTGDINKVQLLDYNVETYGGITYNWEKLGDGFIHNSSYDHRYYKIQGTIKNIAGDMLNTINIKVKFYDNNDNFLAEKTATIHNLTDSNSEDFGVKYNSSESYFDNIDEVQFEITTA